MSFILVASMLFAAVSLSATAVNENVVVVHYYNENNWETPYLYYYNDGNIPVSWPGTAMTSEGYCWFSGGNRDYIGFRHGYYILYL